MARQPYTLIYARGVAKHLKSIDAKYDRLIRDTVAKQLRFEPGVETRNRKPLPPPAPFAAQWEIRFGPDDRFRVLYDIDQEHRTVQVVAIGEKHGNRLISSATATFSAMRSSGRRWKSPGPRSGAAGSERRPISRKR